MIKDLRENVILTSVQILLQDKRSQRGCYFKTSTLIPRNITSQLQCICVSAVTLNAIPCN